MEHGTVRNIPDHPGTSRNIPEHRIIMIIMRKICKITFSKTEEAQQFGSGNAETR